MPDGMSLTEIDQPQGMTEDELESFLGSEISDSIQYIDTEIAPARQQNAEYYLGIMDDVLSPQDRSQVVSRDVSTRVNQMLPSLMRAVFSSKVVGEYRANGIEDEEASKVVTDFVNEVVLRQDNNIELIAYGWGFDGLLNKVGIVKIWWEEKFETEDQTLSDLDDGRFGYVFGRVQGDPELEIIAHQSRVVPVQGQDQYGQMVVFAEEKHDVVVRRTVNKSFVCIAPVAPEDFVISRDATTLEDAIVKSHRKERFIGDLLTEGYPMELLEKLQRSDGFSTQDELIRSGQSNRFIDHKKDDLLRKVVIHEGICRCDADGTGLKEYYFVAGGNSGSFGTRATILKFEPYLDQIYFADFCPNPVPHTFWGRCPADEAKEPQRAKTALMRQVMDNLYLTNNPMRQVYVGGIVGQKLEYAMNSAPGAILPTTTMEPVVRDLAVPFMAAQSMPIIDYWDNEAGERSGSKRGMQPLNDSSLSNIAPTVAAIAQTDREAQTWLIAKIWASGGCRKLFRGILRVLKRYQDFDRMVKMSGQMVKIGPQQWSEFEDWDANINIGLGSKEKEMAVYAAASQKQQEIIEKLGLSNPLVTLGMYAQGLRKMADISGMNADAWFRDLPLDFAPPPQPPPPDPKMVQVQVNAAARAEELKLKREEAAIEIETSTAIKTAELREKARLDQEKSDREFILDTRKMEKEFFFREKEIEAESELKLLEIAAKVNVNTNIPRPE